MKRLNKDRVGVRVRERVGVAAGMVLAACAGGVPAMGQFAGFERHDYPGVHANLFNFAMADANQDGKPDLYLLGGGSGVLPVTIQLNDGNGGFLPPSFLDDAPLAFKITPASMDTNAGLDLLVSRNFFGCQAWLNNGAGSFVSLPVVPPNGGDSAAETIAFDVDGDGDNDAVCMSLNTKKYNVYRNDGGGNLTADPAIDYSPHNIARGAATIDANSDGIPDLGMAHSSTLPAGGLQLFINNGTGTFTPTGVKYPNPSTGGSDTAVGTGDFDDDGRMDVVLVGYGANGNAFGCYLNNGDTTLTVMPNQTIAGNALTKDFGIGDLNGDGKLDVFVGSSQNPQFYYALGNGDGTFATPIAVLTTNTVAGVHVADMDGNGTTDVVVYTQNPAQLQVYLNKTDVVPPTAFNLVSPANNSLDLPRPEAIRWPGLGRPALDWSLAGGFTVGYTVTIATDPALTQVVHQQAGLSQTRYEIPDGVLLDSTTYYWGVTATNAAGATPSTPVSFSFSTPCYADCDGDGVLSIDDFICFQTSFAIGC